MSNTVATAAPSSTLNTWIVRIIMLSFFAQMLLSLNLWFPNMRSYPTIPLWSLFDFELGSLSTSILSTSFLACLLASSFKESSWQKYSLTAALSCLIILLLEDINRFQAWVYIFAAFLSILTWNLWTQQAHKTKTNLQFMMAMIYIWTGAQKLNIQFVTDVYPWLIKIFEPTQWLAAYPFLGYGIGLFEILLGLLLLYPKGQKTGLFLGLCLHSIILILLIKDEWNSVVYPWNIAMILLLFLLFRPSPSLIQKKYLNPIVVFFFGCLPFFDFFHLIPHCLAFGMYSGTSMECDLIINDNGRAACVPPKLQDHLLFKSDRQSILSLDDWGMQDLNIPPFASDRVYRAVAKEFCKCSTKYGGFIEFYYPKRWKDEDKKVVVSCQTLLQE